ncbi:hypothetical protein GCM10020254_25350 [Streptomyces goshikiensis]
MDQHAVAEGGFAHFGTVAAVHRQAAAALLDDLHRALGGAGFTAQYVGEPGRVRGAHGDARAQPGAGEVRGVLVGDEPARLDGDDPVGAACGFLRVGGGEEDGAAEGGVTAQQSVQPGGLPWGDPGGGLVEEQGAGVGEQRGGEGDPAFHAERERPEAVVAQARDADDFQQGVGPGGRHPGGGAEHPQLVAYGPGRVAGDVAEQDADLTARVRDPVQRAAAEIRDPSARFEFEHEPQRGGLARARLAEQGGHAPWAGLEGEVVHEGREVGAGCAGESDGLEHRFSRGGETALRQGEYRKQDNAICPIFLRSRTGVAPRACSRRPGPQTSGRSIGGLSRVAPPARNSWAGRPP